MNGPGHRVPRFELLSRLTGNYLAGEELLDVLWLARHLPDDERAPLARAVRAAGPPAGLSLPPPEQSENTPGGPCPEADAETSPPDHEPLAPQELTDAVHAAAESGTAPEFATLSEGLHPQPLTGALPIRIVHDRLPDRLALTRAMRPLKRQVPRWDTWELDEEATASAMAETGATDVVLRPARQRWLALRLLVDDGISMELWQRLSTEIAGLATHSGVFRDIRVLGLDTRRSGAPWVRNRPFDVRSPLRPSGTVADRSGSTVILVISDGVGAAWRSGAMHCALEQWARLGPTAVVHVLPGRMWRSTGIQAMQWAVRSTRRGSPNAHWLVTDPLLPALSPYIGGVPVPVLEPTRASFGNWSRLVASDGRFAKLSLLVRPRHAGTTSARTRQRPSVQILQRFRDAASPSAYRLAAHLSAVGPLTLPVMQLVRASVPWDATTADLAEVFLGGLMTSVETSGAVPTPSSRLFRFKEDIRRMLLDTVPPTELLRTTRAVATQISALAGRSPSFPAWLARASDRTVTPAPALRPMEAALLSHFGLDPAPVVQVAPLAAGSAAVQLPSGLEAPSRWTPLTLQDRRSVGRYKLELRDGTGDEPTAYIGTTPEGQRVLMRVYSSTAPDGARRLLLTEHRALDRMAGAYAPRVIDEDFESSSPWLALELDTVEGDLPAPTLRAVFDALGTPVAQDVFVWIGHHLSRSLSWSHQAGIVHGSLTPGVVVVSESTLRIVSWASAVTRAGASPPLPLVPFDSPYRAPELRWSGGTGTEAADVYALGAILFEALPGTENGRDTPYTANEDADHTVTSLDDVRQLLLRCLAEEPGQRPTSRDVALAFQALLDSSSP